MTIEARNLHVRYGARPVLKGVDFLARAGEITMIVGPNGSGKTTLLKAISGDLPYTGEVRFNGDDIARLSQQTMAERRGVLAQETLLSFPFTVAEIVRIGLTAGPNAPATAAQADQRIAEALAAVDLSGFAGRFYQELSGGERQRVQLARVLCQIWEPVNDDGPCWLFLDEPVASLDIRHQISIMELARRYADAGGGVIAVMHDLNLTAMYGDRVAMLADGVCAAAGTPEEVIGDDNLSRVFGCDLKVNAAPKRGVYVLPQSAARAIHA